MTRRRGLVLEEAIHEAVFDELASVGYAAFTIEAVAARAKTGKASIYRRWNTKQDLVLDAFCTRFGGPDHILASLADEQLTTRDLLVQLGTGICQMSGEAGELVRAVACEITRDAELAAAVEAQVHRPKQAAILAVLQRGVARGEVRPEAVCELFGDLLPALLTYRVILMNRSVTEQTVAEFVDRILMPLVAVA
jgi:AcrR family transcriptional regulator